MIMFFANACGINVSVSMMVIILLANVLLSVGTPGVPGGAIASFAALATMAGLPARSYGVYISIIHCVIWVQPVSRLLETLPAV